LKNNTIESFLNKFIAGDCETIMAQMPKESIDFVLTSPPYADQRDYGAKNTSIAPDAYVEWFLPKARKIFRILKPNGSFVLNINDKVVDGYQHLYVFQLLLRLYEDVGFKLVRDYIWYNPATPPNVYSRGGHGRTKKSHEYCFWFAKGSEWIFELDPIRKPYSKAMRKYLDGKGTGSRSDNIRPSTHNFNCGKVWADKGGSDPGSVIEIANTNSNDVFMKMCREKGIAHPARFPEKLAEFFVLAGSKEGSIVLDPFSGSGTTAVVSQRYGRNWIGIDINRDYCELAQERIRNETKSTEEMTDD